MHTYRHTPIASGVCLTQLSVPVMSAKTLCYIKWISPGLMDSLAVCRTDCTSVISPPLHTNTSSSFKRAWIQNNRNGVSFFLFFFLGGWLSPKIPEWYFHRRSLSNLSQKTEEIRFFTCTALLLVLVIWANYTPVLHWQRHYMAKSMWTLEHYIRHIIFCYKGILSSR